MRKLFHFSYLCLAFLVGFVVWNVKDCSWSLRTWNNIKEPIVLRDTTYQVEYKDKLSFIDRIKYREVEPDTVILPLWQQWMSANKWTALSVIKIDDRMSITLIRDDSVNVEIYHNIPNSFYFFGTEQGALVYYHRFRNPFRWTGILIGCEMSYSDRLKYSPYIETGLTISRFGILVGTTNEKIYTKAQVRLW